VVLGNALACLVTVPMALPFYQIGVGDWAALAYLGLFQIALAYALVTRAVGKLPALEISIILLVEPVLNPVWSWLVHGERPGVWALGGGALILGATAVRSLLASGADEPPAPAGA
jgi:drug/metabolite transporter (DMT)-like permease